MSCILITTSYENCTTFYLRIKICFISLQLSSIYIRFPPILTSHLLTDTYNILHFWQYCLNVCFYVMFLLYLLKINLKSKYNLNANGIIMVSTYLQYSIDSRYFDLHKREKGRITKKLSFFDIYPHSDKCYIVDTVHIFIINQHLLLCNH